MEPATILAGVLVVLTIGIVAWGIRKDRRKALADDRMRAMLESMRPERVQEMLRRHGGPHRGVLDGDRGPVWTSSDELGMAVAIDGLTPLGFFADTAHLPMKERVAALWPAFEQRHGHPFRVSDDFREPKLAALDTTRVWWRDAEADVGSGNDVYAEVLTQWAEIARGRFAPHDVRETWAGPEGPIEIAFTHRGEPHMLRPAFDRDWLDMDALRRVGACLDDLELMEVHTGDQTAYVLFATVDEAVKLQDRGWPILGRRRESA